MQVHFVLLVGTRAVLLLQRFGAEDEKAWILPPSGPELHDTIAFALKERPAAPVRVVIDCKTLDLKREELPTLNPVERHKIIGRQGAHHFAKSFLRGAGSWRDGSAFHALHAACEAEPQLEALVQQLNKLPNTVEFLSFFATDWHDYTRQMSILVEKPWSMALVLCEATGLRQILIKDGHPAFTRLNEECVPSLGASNLVEPIAVSLRGLRESISRFGVQAPQDIPAQLFVPASLGNLGENELLRGLNCRVVTLKALNPGLLGPEWEADMAWADQAAEQKLPLVPLVPHWMKERTAMARLRQIAVLVMMAFGFAGIYTGSSIMFGHHPQAQLIPVTVEAPPQSTKKAPELKLEAVIYNTPEDWSVWINGQKYSSVAPASGNIHVVSVSAGGVAVHWQEGSVSKDYVLQQDKAAKGQDR